MKIGQIWIDSVIYQSTIDNRVWVREKNDFNEVFEKIPGTTPFSVCVIICDDRGLVLGVSRKDNHNDFGLPGGKIEPGETPDEAIVREVKEETGLDLVGYFSRGVYDCEDKQHGMKPCVVYVGTVRGEINYDEPHVVKWVTPKRLTKGTFGDFNKKTFDKLNIEY
jgi:mutator protein MutT